MWKRACYVVLASLPIVIGCSESNNDAAGTESKDAAVSAESCPLADASACPSGCEPFMGYVLVDAGGCSNAVRLFCYRGSQTGATSCLTRDADGARFFTRSGVVGSIPGYTKCELGPLSPSDTAAYNVRCP